MSIIVFDTETTGLIQTIARPLKDLPEIIELYAEKLDPDTLDTVDTLHIMVKPKKAITQEVTDITSITNEMVADCPPFVSEVNKLANFFLCSTHAVGHNLSFDCDMLTIELRRLAMEYHFPWPQEHICTVEKTEGMKGYRIGLGDLHEELFGEKFDGAHRAQSDVEATVRVFRKLVEDGVIKL